jgi:hypothetical protein
MSDIFSDGAIWLEAQRTEHLTHSVTYSRGASSLTISATSGKTAFRIVDEYGRSVLVFSKDFLLLVADLTLGEPAVGDRITDSGRIFEVLSVAGESHFKLSDPNGLTYRIHTKEII